MIRVIIADSDVENVKNFKAFIKLNFPMMKVDKSVSTLDELYEVIGIRKPNLIIADMKLFGSGVIKVIENYESFSDVKFLLYGTFNDGEYMRKCMEYGAVGYLYKPVKPAELEKVLNTVVKIFDEITQNYKEREELLKNYNEKIILFQTLFLRNLLYGYVNNEREIDDALEYFEIEISSPFVVAVLRIDHFREIAMVFEEQEKHLFIYELLNVIDAALISGKAFINNFNEVVIVTGGFNELENIIKFIDEIKINLQIHNNISISFGIGRMKDNIKDVSVSYKEAVAALRYRCFVGYNSIIPIDYVEPENAVTYRYPLEREELLVYTAVIGEYDYCLKLLKEIFEALEKCGEISQKLLSQIVMDILISINRNAFEQNINIVGVNKFFSTSDVLKIKNLDEAYNYLAEGLKSFCKYIVTIRKVKEDQIFEDAKKYVEEKYYEIINAKKVASVFNCSYDYFKRVFTEHSGMNFYDYVSKIRIEHAKELIENTDFEDEMIALKIGYDDNIIYKTMFKKYAGCTVSDYRYLKNKKINKI